MIWGKRSRNPIQGLGPASLMRRQTGKGEGSDIKPWGVRITFIGFPSDAAGCVSISVVLVVVGWMNGCMEG